MLLCAGENRGRHCLSLKRNLASELHKTQHDMHGGIIVHVLDLTGKRLKSPGSHGISIVDISRCNFVTTATTIDGLFQQLSPCALLRQVYTLYSTWNGQSVPLWWLVLRERVEYVFRKWKASDDWEKLERPMTTVACTAIKQWCRNVMGFSARGGDDGRLMYMCVSTVAGLMYNVLNTPRAPCISSTGTRRIWERGCFLR